ncbi:lysozyme g-like protein 2 [Acomys russatus]|uniref:lysozyme g-like protein 2 n=1 Tax=Acomys russatus TaxID=60746 RepID=UPI0021E25E52|nr:lysozyme g-like protein 2 [Acomys russatus]
MPQCDLQGGIVGMVAGNNLCASKGCLGAAGPVQNFLLMSSPDQSVDSVAAAKGFFHGGETSPQRLQGRNFLLEKPSGFKINVSVSNQDRSQQMSVITMVPSTVFWGLLALIAHDGLLASAFIMQVISLSVPIHAVLLLPNSGPFTTLCANAREWYSFCLPGTSRGSYPFTHPVNPHLHHRLYHGCYGDIMTMETFGAPCDINSLMYCGVHGSEMFAEMDLKAIRPYRVLIKEVGQRHCIDPAVIAAIISRESHGGVVLQNGWDHKGQRFGLMQLDKKLYHPIGSWDSKEHLLQSAGILAEKLKAIQRKFPTWNAVQHLKGGLTAFKSGTDAIVTPEDIEADLADDVIARAKFYKRHGF